MDVEMNKGQERLPLLEMSKKSKREQDFFGFVAKCVKVDYRMLPNGKRAR